MLTLIANANLYSPEAVGIRHLLIGGGKLLWLGEDLAEVECAAIVERIDVEGLRLVPGFVDGHAHLTGGGGESGFASRVPPPALSRYTAAGVTSVVGVLGTDDVTRSAANLVAQARGLREEGLSAWCHCGGYHLPPSTLTGDVTQDIVHIDPVIGVGELAISDHRSSQPTLAELLRIAGQCHVAGLISGKAGILHLHLGDGPRGLALIMEALQIAEIPARVYNPTHVNRQTDLFAQAQELACRGSTVDLTAYPMAAGDPGLSAAEALLQWLDADLPADRITVSSDGGGCLPTFNEDGELLRMGIGEPQALHDCLQAVLAAGVPLEQALPAFTENPARLLRLTAKGRLQIGADADLLVLDAEGEIRDVMAKGRWHRRGYRTILRGQFEVEP